MERWEVEVWPKDTALVPFLPKGFSGVWKQWHVESESHNEYANGKLHGHAKTFSDDGKLIVVCDHDRKSMGGDFLWLYTDEGIDLSDSVNFDKPTAQEFMAKHRITAKVEE